jgi:hypothetical protein
MVICGTVRFRDGATDIEHRVAADSARPLGLLNVSEETLHGTLLPCGAGGES